MRAWLEIFLGVSSILPGKSKDEIPSVEDKSSSDQYPPLLKISSFFRSGK